MTNLSMIARRLGVPSSSCKRFTAANSLEYVQVSDTPSGHPRFYLLQGSTLTRVTQPRLEKKLRLTARERWIRPKKRFVMPKYLLIERLRLMSELRREGVRTGGAR